MAIGIAALAYWAVFIVSWLALGWSAQADSRPAGRLSPWGIGIWLAVAIPTLLQLAWAPWLLAAGERDTSTLAEGQFWRLLTAIALQDGGWIGGVFNLAFLGVSLALAADVLGGPWMAVTFLGGGILANLLTAATFGQTGAGNSMATMVMVVAAATTTIAGWRSRQRQVAVLTGLVASDLVLLALRDQHGIAVTLGLVMGIGFVWAGLSPRTPRPGPPPWPSARPPR